MRNRASCRRHGNGVHSVTMDTRPTAPLRAEHAGFLTHIKALRELARAYPGLDDAARRAGLAEATGFLRGTLIPHAQLEEAVLYPAWARLVGDPDAAVTMVHDHAAIVARIDRLEQVDPTDVDAAQELLYGLHALITVHFDAEETIQLAAFDAAPEAGTALLRALQGHHG